MNTVLLIVDFYKYSHWVQYPKNTTKVYSYLESRGGKFDNTVFYGLQYYLKNYLSTPITLADVEKAKRIVERSVGPNIFHYEGWLRIVNYHAGKLPIRIKAVPEGKVIATHNVLATFENTDEQLPWITNFCETLLLMVWYPTTVATLSREIKKVFLKYLRKTTTYTNEQLTPILNFMLNDFGVRGSSSPETSFIGGSAHLVNFLGTDNVGAIDFVQKYYNTDDAIGYSVPASEHSTITSWGKEHEVDAFENMLDAYTGIRACVSDSFDICKAIEEYWGTVLHDKIINLNGKIVFRPDSGDPAQTLKVLFPIIWEKFRGHINEKDYKVFHPNVGLIQGDGVNYESIGDILDVITELGVSAENIVFGMGGELLQKVHRDTQNFAIKCSHVVIEGREVDVQKNPLEIDKNGNRVQSFKKSKSGRLKFVNGKTVENATDEDGDELVLVFLNGDILKEYTFEEVRFNAGVDLFN